MGRAGATEKQTASVPGQPSAAFERLRQPLQREVRLIAAENGSQESLLSGLCAFVQNFPSEIPLRPVVCSSCFMMLFCFFLAVFNSGL